MIIMDACTVILLAKATVLESFTKAHLTNMTRQAFAEVMEGEVKMHQDALVTKRLNIEKKLGIVESKENLTQSLMADFNMAEGEASTVAVGITEKCIVATDNRQGRKASVVNGLGLVGSPEIIVAMQKTGNITKEKAVAALTVLKKEGWFENQIIEKATSDLK